MSESEQNAIRDLVGKHKIEGDLRREIASNIKRLKEIKTYRGTRHSKRLPSRGQRTKTNSRTLRGKCPHHNGQWKKESGKDIKLWEHKKIIEAKRRGRGRKQAPPLRRVNPPKVKVSNGTLYIRSTYNNTLMTLADKSGNALFASAAEPWAFKGLKGTPFASAKIAELFGG